MVREFREVFGGRFTAKDTRRIFRHVNWNRNDAINFVLKSEYYVYLNMCYLST